jgi:signal transduction histidine kinase
VEHAGSGLQGLRDRVEAIGGTLAVESRFRLGTRVTAIIPESFIRSG